MKDKYFELNQQINELEEDLDKCVTLEQKLKVQNKLLKTRRDLLYKYIEYSVEKEGEKEMKYMLCPKCGEKLTINTHKQLLSSPPQYPIWCCNCDYKSGIDCEEYLKLEGEIRIMNKSTITMETKKIRGFEFVSMNQGLKDFEDVDVLDCELKLPKRGTSKSAGYDIFAPYEITLQPNEEIKVPTGLKAYMQDGEVLMAFPRSGLGFKYYCRLANTVGVIDGDYYNNADNEGHMFVKLRNEGTKEMTINQGDGMCQMIFMPFLLVDGDSFDEGEERKGGFGSTTK